MTRQLFEPLVMQLIHWFTNNRKFESQDTVAVLEAILVNSFSRHTLFYLKLSWLSVNVCCKYKKKYISAAQDGIVDPLDSTLRDFSGTCIQEFVKWSIKQTTPKQQEKSPANIKSLFKRIYSLALHPNVFKRLGAALAFNSMYRQFRSVCDELHSASQQFRNIFYFILSECKKSVVNGNGIYTDVYPNIILFLREESSLVEQFVFEVLVVFVESLALAHFDEKSLGKTLDILFINTSCLMVMTVIFFVILLLSTQELSNSVVVPWII